MLIIYGALGLGGIETFFVRLAKERFKKNKKTKILLLTPAEFGVNNSDLFETIKKYAEIYYFDDVFDKKIINWRFFLLHHLNKENLKKILIDCEQIHVTDAQNALLAESMLSKINKKIPITVGMYHSLEFAWGNDFLPFFEKINRKFIYEVLDSNNIICFSQTTKDFVRKKTGYDIVNAHTFRLGVIESNKIYKSSKSSKSIRMCAVGRLADFKTYNFWMPEVIKKLNNDGYSISLDIYGDGDKENEVKSAIKDSLSFIRLLPPFKYSNFDEIVSRYDLFIGSGTAIIQAASLGIPSIIGIESISEPLTYGFFTDFYQYEYHLKSLNFEKVEVYNTIKEFIEMPEKDKQNLSFKHYQVAHFFSISNCEESMSKGPYSLSRKFIFNKYRYTLSQIFFRILMKVRKKSIYHDDQV